MFVHQFLHGYKKGHQLLAGSTQLDAKSIELITRLSDLSGSMTSTSEIHPYLTCYPLPNQQYYALAKTWLDTSAQRTGCVLTHTLLIPVNTWITCSSPFNFNRLFVQPIDSKDTERYREGLEIELQPNSISNSNSPMNSALLIGFVHRFFGEGVSPIIWFDEENPESIFWKLTGAFWSNLRSKFSCCTLCLQPRFLEEKPFDLMFAPSSAYTRFHEMPRDNILDHSNYKHSINAGNFVDEPWINEWTDYLLEGSTDNNLLEEMAEFGPLLSDDPTAVKKIYLIQELRKRSKKTPIAMVGLMDVVESLAPGGFAALHYKENILSTAVQFIGRSNEQDDVLKSLVLISDRLSHNAYGMLSQEKKYKFYDLVAKYVNKDPVEAIKAAERLFNAPSDIITSAYIRGLITGLLSIGNKQPSRLLVLHQFPNASPLLIDIEPRLGLLFLQAYKSSDRLATGLDDLASWILRISGSETRRTLCKILLPEVNNDSYELLLEELLEQLNEDDAEWVLDTLSLSTNGFSPVRIRKVICNHISMIFVTSTREWACQTSIWSTGAAELVSATYSMDLEGLKELLQAQGFGYLRKAQIIAAFISGNTPNHPFPRWLLEFARNSPDLLPSLLTMSESISEDVTKVIQKILNEVPELPLSRLYDVSEIDNAISIRQYSFKAELAAVSMRSAFSEYLTGNIDLETYKAWESTSWGTKWAGEITIWELESLLNQKCSESTTAWLRGWKWLSSSSKNLYQTFPPYLPKLINRLLSINKWGWNEEVTDLWVIILDRIHSQGKKPVYLQVCAEALNFAFRHDHYPVSRVIVEAFLPIYNAVVQSEEIPSEVYDLFGYFNWDKQKELRRKLVDTFFESTWPAGDLALSAGEKFLLRKIYSRLSRKWDGKEYIQAIANDLMKRKKDPKISTVLKEFTSLMQSRNFSEPWD